jgi:MtfA peptidase
MPKDSIPYLLTYKDSSFAIYSAEEYIALPDTIRTRNVDSQFYTQQVLREFQVIQKSQPEYNTGDYFYFSVLFFSALAFIIAFYLAWRDDKKTRNVIIHVPEQNEANLPLLYKGADLNFSDEEIKFICSKYNSYFQKLSIPKRTQFVRRLNGFMHSKTFYIYANRGVKEMPVLISAAAIQITFGLDEYMFPYFRNIIVHPDAYIALNPLRILMGNVHGNSITLSWKHFLEDYTNPTDGKNVGLHEMAHALQVQYLFSKRNKTNNFKEDFEHYDRADDEVLMQTSKTNSLFDSYALKDKNELWAASVELFFERPADLKKEYTELYNSIKLVLNQDPVYFL